MYKTILVPLDGSKRAERILPHVENLAMHSHATLILIQVVEPPPLIVGPEGDITLHQQDMERLTSNAEDYIAATRGKLQEKGIETLTRVAHGPVVEAIITAAEREGADLIAIASHGRSGLSQVFYGSVAAGVLHRIDRPLLVIRSHAEE
jgi:nucleotide-binding universal stress UspA family protein